MIKGYLSRPSDLDDDPTMLLEEKAGRHDIDPELLRFLAGSSLPESWKVFNRPEKTISEFYKNSRLHWLSTWRMELADLVAGFKREQAIRITNGAIMHIDIDCFFVGVAVRNKPELRNHPVAICHGKGATSAHAKNVNQPGEAHLYEKYRKVNSGGRVEAGESFSEIASCSYSAREKGIRSNMYLGQALKLCPELVCLVQGTKSLTRII